MEDNKNEIISSLKAQRILPLFYYSDSDTCIEVMKSLYAGGVRIVEFTNRGEAARRNFKRLLVERENLFPEMLIGIGTIKTKDEAQTFADLGADFLVSPVFDLSVCEAANLNQKLWIPGCMTPTEIHTATQAGCRVVKLFPGNVLTPAFVSAVRALFINVDYLVTGGIQPQFDDMRPWFKAGASILGLGSQFINDDLITRGKYELLSENTRSLLSSVQVGGLQK